MPSTRRDALRLGGLAAVAATAGCATLGDLTNGDAPVEWVLRAERIDASPVEDATYEPSEDRLFGEPARTALDAVIPDGTHQTDGFRPVSDDTYVARDGRYYRLSVFVTNRVRRERTLVRANPLGENTEPPDDALLVDDLPRPTARVVKILHNDATTGGASELLRDGAYVLRRPVELESRLASGAFDGRVVRLSPDGPWNYRLRTDRATITEPRYTIRADQLTDDRATFREIVFATRVDVELTPDELSNDARSRLESAIRGQQYTEQVPVSEPFETLTERLGVADTDVEEFSRIKLWYDEEYYRCTFVVRRVDRDA